MLAAHRRDAREAARGLSALFRGETTPGALAAGIRLHTAIEYGIAVVEARAKAPAPRRQGPTPRGR
jgi:hypothetical protein